jgi:hypothetical protein
MVDEAQARAALAEVQRQRGRQADRVRVPRWFAVAYGAALVALFAAPAIIVGAAGERKSPLIITVIALGAAGLSMTGVFVVREAGGHVRMHDARNYPSVRKPVWALAAASVAGGLVTWALVDAVAWPIDLAIGLVCAALVLAARAAIMNAVRDDIRAGRAA